MLLRLAGRAGTPPIPIDGSASPGFIDAITAFQKEVMNITPDGRVEPSSATFRALLSAATPEIHRLTRFPAATGHRNHLTRADYVRAATALNCTPEAIMAVSAVESKGAPFLHSGKPKILFEAQIFGAKTHHLYDLLFPDISRRNQLNRRQNPHAYGKDEEQWLKLKLAALMDRQAAIESASRGRFQILGKNWRFTNANSQVVGFPFHAGQAE